MQLLEHEGFDTSTIIEADLGCTCDPATKKCTCARETESLIHAMKMYGEAESDSQDTPTDDDMEEAKHFYLDRRQ